MMLNTLALVVLSWTAPTLNTDGSPLLNLDHYNVKRGACSGGVYLAPAVEVLPVPAASTSVQIEGLADGEHCFVVTAVNALGIESENSNSAMTVITTEPPPPPPPTTLKTVVKKVMEMKFPASGVPYLSRQIGTAPLGTACIEPMLKVVAGTKPDYYEVTSYKPLSGKTLAAGAKAVAQCK